jgi:hypothetical protein
MVRDLAVSSPDVDLPLTGISCSDTGPVERDSDPILPLALLTHPRHFLTY